MERVAFRASLSFPSVFATTSERLARCLPAFSLDALSVREQVFSSFSYKKRSARPEVEAGRSFRPHTRPTLLVACYATISDSSDGPYVISVATTHNPKTSDGVVPVAVNR